MGLKLLKGHIQIFAVCRQEHFNEIKSKMHELVISGRLPITAKNIKIIIFQHLRIYKL